MSTTEKRTWNAPRAIASPLSPVLRGDLDSPREFGREPSRDLVWGLGFRGWNLGCRVKSFGFTVRDLGFEIWVERLV